LADFREQEGEGMEVNRR